MAKKPDTQLSHLANYARKKPTKHGAHHSGKTPTLRSFLIGKRKVDIATIYKVWVDGKIVKMAIVAAPDGSVTCHDLPFYVANSAVDVVKAVLQARLASKTKSPAAKPPKKKPPKKKHAKKVKHEPGHGGQDHGNS